MQYRNLYEAGKAVLETAGVKEYELDARLLLEYVCHTSRHDLLVHGDREIPAETEEEYWNAIKKREQRMPLQYITGEQEFMGLVFRTHPEVLIPRQDTETLTEEAMRYLQDGMSILDLCTGTGCILLSLLNYSNHCTGTGVDLSPAAVGIAKENAKSLGIESAEFLQSDLFEKVNGCYDMIVSNPPYIPTRVIPELMEEVREYEPKLALDGREDGLFFYREIARESRDHLRCGGYLFFEIGHDQGDDVVRIMEANEYQDVRICQDLAGMDRVVYGWKP